MPLPVEENNSRFLGLPICLDPPDPENLAGFWGVLRLTKAHI